MVFGGPGRPVVRNGAPMKRGLSVKANRSQRRLSLSLIRIPLLAALFLSLFSQPLFSATNEFLSVQVKQGQLRATPFFLGKVKALLAYGDRVELIEDRGAWKMVAIRKIKGWMHVSALSAKRIVLQAGKTDAKTGTTSSELAVAGKGFNAKVEAEFKSRNKNIDYGRVDKMEALAIKPAQMQAFLKQGQVQAPEGGVP
jgi:SH3-like domain-containing protein